MCTTICMRVAHAAPYPACSYSTRLPQAAAHFTIKYPNATHRTGTVAMLKKYPMHVPYFLQRARETVSLTAVENVENPPRKPVAIIMRAAAGSAAGGRKPYIRGCAAIPAIIPIAKEARALIIKVDRGKLCFHKRLTAPSSAKRHTAPIPPHMHTAQNSDAAITIHVSPHCCRYARKLSSRSTPPGTHSQSPR